MNTLEGDELRCSIGYLVDAIATHVDSLSDEKLQQMAFVIADDLYKTASRIKIWHKGIAQYLGSTADSFFQILAQRGFFLHYVIDNSCDDTPRLCDLFPVWFKNCGFVFECPQILASKNLVTIAEARRICNSNLNENSGRFHYILMDIDSNEESFKAPLAQMKSDKIITIMRDEAPTPGSHIMISLSGKFLRKKTFGNN